MSFRNIFTKLFVLYSSMVFYSFAYYSKKDAFCTGKQLTLLPQKIYSICGTYVSKKDALTPPIVKVERVPKHEAKKYILIMIDPDRFPDSKWVWLHWMKTNIPTTKPPSRLQGSIEYNSCCISRCIILPS
uniref:Phosphatidylethanolamine-binding protein 4 n=1 Tax=Octopus bimaculoides TaxID=37653 RepID=A0A0L8HWG7_OCTBM